MIYFNIAWFCCICGGYDRARPGRGPAGGKNKKKKAALRFKKGKQATTGSGAWCSLLCSFCFIYFLIS